jgi:uncharacterized protein
MSRAAGNDPEESSVLRPDQIQARAGRQPLVPGKPVYARVELLPFEHVFRKGSSIRNTIDSASGTVQSTGLWALTPPPGRFTDTIYVSPAQLSQVVLGLIPGARARAAMPACGSIAGEPCRHNQVPVPAGILNLP